MIKNGDRGARVVEVQEMLLKAGYILVADGIFGPQTERLIREFQRQNGLLADGIVGPKTRAALVAQAQPVVMEQYLAGPMAWLVCGHGGVDAAGLYTTKQNGDGKFFEHSGEALHLGTPYFYEGHENRIVGWLIAEELIKRGIRYRMVNEEVADVRRSHLKKIIEDDVDRGAWGLCYNIHSNASLNHNALGISTFVEVGTDIKAMKSLKVAAFWRDLVRKTGLNLHGSGIHRRNFDMLANVPVPSVLEEWRFFDNRLEVGKIIKERRLRAKIAADAIEYGLEVVSR